LNPPGICSWSFEGVVTGRRRAADVVSAAKQFGFDSVEGVFALRGSFAAGSEPLAADSAHVRSLATLQLHRFHLADTNERRRAMATEIVRNMIDCAAACRIPSVSLSPGPMYGSEPDRVLAALAQALEPELDHAHALGVSVALENVPGHLLQTRQALSQLLRRLGSNVSVCLDIGNTVADPPAAEWLQQFGHRLRKLHVSDGRMVGGRFVAALPGEGDVDWSRVIRCVEEVQPACEVFVEAPLPAGAKEKEFLAELRRAVDRVWTPASGRARTDTRERGGG
jgi:sugar phosphate isomerase/epimerase